MPMPIQRHPHHDVSLPANFFPGRPPGFIPPAYSPPYLLFDFATVTASNTLIPSQVKFSKLKGATGNNSSDDVSVAEIGSAGFSTGIGLGNSFDTFNTKPEEEIIFESLAPVDSALVALLYRALTTSTPVSDLGPHLIWEKFVLRILSSFWRFHQPVHCVCIRCRTSSLRWVIALIYKLLLIAWDLWQYKTD